jgi:hypothetical protein
MALLFFALSTEVLLTRWLLACREGKLVASSTDDRRDHCRLAAQSLSARTPPPHVQFHFSRTVPVDRVACFTE